MHDSEETKPSAPCGEGTVLCAGRYELHDRLGAGTSGTVYRAVDRTLSNAVVALKLLHGILSDRAAADRRFQREMRLLRSLSHPNIVRVFDFGRTEDSTPFIVMEYLEGETLEERLRGSKGLDPTEAMHILDEVLQALEAMHAAGVVHCDIKPGNVHLGSDGTVKVLDFGVSKSLTQSSGLTMMTQAVGTPRYMAPEQLHSGDVDPRSDFYAAGLLAYELACGEPFFREDSVYGIAAAQQEARHRLQSIFTNQPQNEIDKRLVTYPPAYRAAIVHCLHVDPNERPATAMELRRAFFAEGQLPNVGAPEQPGAFLLKLRALGALAVVLFVLAGCFRFVVRASPELQAALLPLVLSVERRTDVTLTPVKDAIGYPQVVATEQYLGAVLRLIDARYRGQIVDLLFTGKSEALVIRALLEAGVDPNGTDEFGVPYIQYAFTALSTVQAMIEFGADVCTPFPDGTAVLKAIERQVAVREILTHSKLHCPRSVFTATTVTGGYTAIHLLAEWHGGEAQVIPLLLSAAPELLEMRDAVGATPLMRAAQFGNPRLIALLVAHGADLFAKDSSQMTALHTAIYLAKQAAVAELLRYDHRQLFVEEKYQRTPLILSATTTDQELALEVLAATIAAVEKEAAIAKEEGVEPRHTLRQVLEHRDHEGRTVLWEAVQRQHPKLVAALLELGADIETTSDYLDRPLAAAAAQGNDAMIRQLLAAGADVNARHGYGRTTLHIAANYFRSSTIELLLAAGADPTLRDGLRRLPSDQARAVGSGDDAARLEAAEAAWKAKAGE